MFDASRCADECIKMFKAGMITLDECDVAIAFYWNMEGELK